MGGVCGVYTPASKLCAAWGCTPGMRACLMVVAHMAGAGNPGFKSADFCGSHADWSGLPRGGLATVGPGMLQGPPSDFTGHLSDGSKQTAVHNELKAQGSHRPAPLTFEEHPGVQALCAPRCALPASWLTLT